MQADEQKIALFEKMSIPRATLNLAVPTVVSSLVMVLYNLADTYFVGSSRKVRPSKLRI